MNPKQQEAVARMVLQDLRHTEDLQKQARGDWRRRITGFLVPTAIFAVIIWGPEDRWVVAGIVFAIMLLSTNFELFRTNKRIDALMRLHETLQRRFDKAQETAESNRPLEHATPLAHGSEG